MFSIFRIASILHGAGSKTFNQGVPLTPDRREGLLDLEATANPELNAQPWLILVSKEPACSIVDRTFSSGRRAVPMARPMLA
jgi:hypothetical protein